jgi:cytidylate kinase
LAGIQARDARDSNRSAAPLEVPPGAIIINTTDMSISQMVDELVHRAQRVFSALEQEKLEQ